MPVIEEIILIEIEKGICKGRVSNFNVETAAIKESVKWAKQNKRKDILIRSDSMVVIQRVKDMKSGLSQEVMKEVKKLRQKIKRKVYIEWVKVCGRDKKNEIADRAVREARSKS